MTNNKYNNIFTTLGATNHSEGQREKDDFYATEPKALELFLDKLKEDNIQLSHNIWECCCGAGHLAEVLRKNEYEVMATDLIDRNYGMGNVDFLEQTEKWGGDILTNPPYKYAQKIIEHALDLVECGNKVIMFLKVQFLEGKARKKMFENNPPKYIYISSSRLNCAKNGDFETYKSNSAIAYAWYVWEKGYKGDPSIRWFN